MTDVAIVIGLFVIVCELAALDGKLASIRALMEDYRDNGE